MSRYLLYLLAAIVLVADQATKQWVLHVYPTWPQTDVGYSRDLIPGFFSLTYVNNTGGAFGILPSGTGLLALAALAAAIGIVVFTLRMPQVVSCQLALALALPLGGALGNLLDRVRLHYVVDFLDVHIGRLYQWPVFNVADSAICIGVALLALYFWRQPTGDKSGADSVAIEEAPQPGISDK